MKEDPKKQNLFLLAELQSGEERAFDSIFREYYKSLCAQANLYVKDLDKAQSLVQECFVKLWENRSDVERIKNLSSYLSFMVRNQCIDYLRKIKAQENNSEIVAIDNSENKSEELLLAFDFEERLVVALSMLPQRSREAFEYSRFENLSYKEIAEKMNISVKGVEALVGRSLKILRNELKEYLPLLIVLFRLPRFYFFLIYT